MDRLYKAAISQVDFLLAVVLDDVPTTLNHYFNDILQERGQRRIKVDLKKKTFSDCKIGEVFRYDDILMSHSMSNVDHSIRDLHDILRSWYKAVRKRFLNFVCQQAAEYDLITAQERLLYRRSEQAQSSILNHHLGSNLPFPFPKLAPTLFTRARHFARLTRSRNLTPLLRYLFPRSQPHTRGPFRARLFNFRHETIPYYTIRAQSRIYRYLGARQARRRENKALGKGILTRLGGTRAVHRTFQQRQDGRGLGREGLIRERKSMDGEGGYAAREPGARRRKLAGYLKAANELRQTYQQAYVASREERYDDDDDAHMPGSFANGTIVRSDNEEMLLFPSYARRHVRKMEEETGTGNHDRPGQLDEYGTQGAQTAGDAEHWKKEWDRYEDQNAVIDVDIRGWIFAPQQGQLSRKNRILIGMARKLSGIPAPAPNEQADSHSLTAKLEAKNSKQEEELVEKEAQRLERIGRGEAKIAQEGGYSEGDTHAYDSDRSSLTSGDPSPMPKSLVIARKRSNDSLRGIQQRASWQQPADMSPEELAIANQHLMTRLKPFLTTALANIPLTVFFYNDDTSKSRTITTNESGHFNYRAPLDFVPTHVRVLASDKLSATEPIIITEPTGVSLISDIDDTIKHSAITSGAREIFRNAFIRDLKQLGIDGVKEWYRTLADMGVKFHYVSNSPWQFYPILTGFFKSAGLPDGSFHLKQYPGLLQGIFEPVAERKKGTLEKVLADFPERRFILVGDSGEADLEVYTDIVLANPGRILAVFIRDVTSPPGSSFFESIMRDPAPSPPRSRNSPNESPQRSAASTIEKRPELPPRPSARSSSTLATIKSSETTPSERLIDFDDESPAPAISRSNTAPAEEQFKSPTTAKSLPPARPPKPAALSSQPTANSTAITRKPAPPPPPKPRQPNNASSSSTPADPSPLSQSSVSSEQSSDQWTYTGAVRNKVSAAYNSLPSFYASNLNLANHSLPTTSIPHSVLANKTLRGPAPPPPAPRRALTTSQSSSANNNNNNNPTTPSSPSAATTSPNSSDYNNNNGDAAYNNYNSENQEAGNMLSKKEELWLRRWERARGIFKEKGVLLRSWRIGEDVADECVRVVEKAFREDEKTEKKMGRREGG